MIRFRMIWGGVLVAFMGTSCSNHEDQSSMNKVPCDYQSPVDYDITLAGNFGEPRPWHFHGGLDIKTNNQEGKQIFSIADGYVCRLTVNKFGFGNAIYVSHPDGHTSIYCHLQKFAPCYEEQLKRTGRDTLDIHFADNQFPVKAGDLIAFSGNTGHSTGPHLHLEIHDTQTWAMRDPMEFLGHLIADSIAPQAHSLMAVPVEGQGVFNGVDTKQIFGFGQSDRKVQNSTLKLQRAFTAWGKVGFALWADDYSEATYNHYGIRYIQLTVDGREVFNSNADSIPISCQPEVNLWGDFDHWRHTRIWYMKLYREPSMRLPILHTGFDRGIVNFNQERNYYFMLVLRDYQNNRATYEWTVRGERNNSIKLNNNKQLWDEYLYWQQCLWPLHTPRPARTS